MSYKFYLDDMLLPLPPSEMTISVGDKNETIELLNERDLVILRNPALKEISFSVVFPSSKVPYAEYLNDVFEPPSEFITKIQKLKYDKKKFLFVVVRSIGKEKYFDSNIPCVLSNFDVYEGVDEGFDIKVNFNLKEYKEPRTQVGKITQDEKGNSIIQYEKVVPTENLKIGNVNLNNDKNSLIYKVKNETETLWQIAKKVYDDGSKYTELKIFETLQEYDEYENNGPNYLKVNQQVLLLEKALRGGG